jgi:hypothetical protein
MVSVTAILTAAFNTDTAVTDVSRKPMFVKQEQDEYEHFLYAYTFEFCPA